MKRICELATMLVVLPIGIVPMTYAQETPSYLLNAMTIASRAEHSLSADIVLTWKTGGVSKRSSGTIRLMKPNYARIDLHGDYPQRVLVSDGRRRYFASSDSTYESAMIDANGSGVDSPWWGLPFRFFFTQSLNPFGAKALSAVYTDLEPVDLDGRHLHGVRAKATSPMGAYVARFLFDEAGDLIQSSVQFGEKPGATLFEAKLSNIRHSAAKPRDFVFTPQPGQVPTSMAESMLALGEHAPPFTLSAPDGHAISLASEQSGKKAMLVNFWYYNCAPCRIEFPEFEKLYEQFQSQGLGIIAIDRGDPVNTVVEYVRRTGLTFPIVLGGEPKAGSVFDRYKITDAFPGTYLLDDRGVVVYRSAGEDLQGLKRALTQLGLK
jgi:peroxiredoxin/outer membrane lipoprotein-sorting protein